MTRIKFVTTGFLAGCSLFAIADGASAQARAVTKTTTTVTTAPSPPSAQPAPAQAAATLPGAGPDEIPPTGTDHALMVRHFGIGFMGTRSIIIDPNANPTTVDAPVIGARYWLDPMIGVDAGIGLLFSGGSTTAGGVSTDTQGFSVFILHGGLPLSLASSRHFSFQVVPELNFGVGSSKRGGTGDALKSVHFDLGARAGAEIQFGFIGIPELSLQAGLGLAFSYDHVKDSAAAGPVTFSHSSLGTSVGDNPWNIFTGNVAALYYFD